MYYNREKKSDAQTKHGKPWDIVGKFSDFVGADILRNGVLLQDGDNLEVKIKRMSDGYVVKTRRKKDEEPDKEQRKRSKKRSKK